MPTRPRRRSGENSRELSFDCKNSRVCAGTGVGLGEGLGAGFGVDSGVGFGVGDPETTGSVANLAEM